MFRKYKFLESLHNINIYLYRFNKKVYILFLRFNPFVFYYSFFGFGIGNCFYSSTSFCGFVIRLYKRRVRSSLNYIFKIFSLASQKYKTSCEKNKKYKINENIIIQASVNIFTQASVNIFTQASVVDINLNVIRIVYYGPESIKINVK